MPNHSHNLDSRLVTPAQCHFSFDAWHTWHVQDNVAIRLPGTLLSHNAARQLISLCADGGMGLWQLGQVQIWGTIQAGNGLGHGLLPALLLRLLPLLLLVLLVLLALGLAAGRGQVRAPASMQKVGLRRLGSSALACWVERRTERERGYVGGVGRVWQSLLC